MAKLIISTNGRPVAQFPTFLRRKDCDHFLRLKRVDVFELNGRMMAEPIYDPLFTVIKVGGEIDIITSAHVFIFTKWRPFFNAFRHNRI